MKKNTNLKKNLVKKSILPAAFAVLGSSIALTSVSYAWFTRGNSASLGTIDVNVASADGLQISTGVGEWKSLIDVTELEAIPTNHMQTGKKINPVSTTNAVNTTTGFLDMYKAEFDSSNYMSTTKVNFESSDTNLDVIVFDIYVKLDADAKLFLDNGSEIKPKNPDVDLGIEDCVRVGFVDMGNAATLDAAKKITDYNTNAHKGTTAVIWEPNSQKHSPKVDAYYNNVGSIDDQYYGINADIVTGDHITKELFDKDGATHGALVTTKTTTGLGVGQTPIAELEKDFNKIRVFVWVEGQDVDTINANAGLAFQTNINFVKENVVKG